MSFPLRAFLVFIVLMGTLVILMMLPVQAMSGHYQQGKSLAQGIPLPQPGSPGAVPGYGGTDLPQSRITANDLDGLSAASSQVQENEGGKFLVGNSQDREKFTLDPHTDPIFKEANKIVANPQEALKEEIKEVASTGGAREETKICEESGDETIEEGEEFRVVTVRDIPIIPHRVQLYGELMAFGGGEYTRNVITGAGSNPSELSGSLNLLNPLPAALHSRVVRVERVPQFSCGGTTHSFNEPFRDQYLHTDNYWEHQIKKTSSFNKDGTFYVDGCKGFFGGTLKFPVYLNFDIFYKALPTEEDVTERIDNNCQYLEEKVEKGLCSYEHIIVTEGPQTRVINGYPVTRDWWRRKLIYRCRYPSKNDCGALRAKGCYQTKSSCKKKVRDVCVVWEQTHQCPSGKKAGKTYKSSNRNSPFCLSGDCADQSYESNRDFAEVMSHMSVLKEAGDDLRNFGAIFKGQDRRCTRHCVDFKDCCGNGNGWGVSLKLASCDAGEKELAELRKKNRCIQVGTYCAEKVLGVCIRKKTTFCCYGTKLAKIVQEQGKRQLGLGFGDPKNPQCQGLTAEQLASLDFSKIDFSALFADIAASTKTPNPETITKGIQRSMETRGSLLKIKEKETNQHRKAMSPVSIKDAQSPDKVQGRTHGQF